jgi:diguanylate cyclase (GGDEF)-like protein
MFQLGRLVSQLATAMLEVEDFQALLQEATEEIASAVKADFVAIHLEQSGSRYEFRFDRGGKVPSSFSPLAATRIAEAVGRRSQVIHDANARAGLADAGLKAAIVTPVAIGKDETLHLCVAFGGHGRALSPDEVEGLESIASLLALGASRHGFQQLAVYDPFTKLYNRRYLEGALPAELERARRYRQPLALLAIDIDHFKQINDRHGHPAGDKVLSEISRVLLESIRSCDAAVRYGGDEFLVIFPATPATGARRIAARILERIRALSFGDARAPFRVTVSGGVALADGASTADTLLAEADRNLYLAKRERDDIHVPELTPVFDEPGIVEIRHRRRHAGI